MRQESLWQWIQGSCYTKENKFDFLNEVAVEANAYAESNRDEYGSSKKTIMHVLSNESLSHWDVNIHVPLLGVPAVTTPNVNSRRM